MTKSGQRADPPMRDAGATQACADKPVLIGIDWGSSNLRVALVDEHGGLMDRRESPVGVFAVQEGHFAEALLPLCADWLVQHQVPLLACGMIGSRQGISDVPYVTCPASANDLAERLGQVELPPVDGLTPGQAVQLHIVAGLNTGSHAAGWDVLRGEETQLFGLPDGAARLFVLPGTHSKWMKRSGGGQIETFQTYMTGELFELLRNHSSLSRVMSAGPASPKAFQQGVAEACAKGLENLLFRVRTAGLMGRFQSHELPDYLSGLLIGAEIKAGLSRFSPPDKHTPIPLLGSPELTQRYASAFAQFGQAVVEMPGDAVFNGLLRIARAAGLLNRATVAT
ncbi:2-dehydro-3-deoxygalactonokinase [Hydrogenophaga sp. PAMC20947]|uniref:2-dehydro-3-deoxygalactonokinase n=1 Tax=Hydrogenophaga sp. PAMC20947 TaxID=2565558 RepID=UPI00144776C4|nr:2-dehydro-3-deoxygalactonokinase [Hydrogenophaga sp. PAMC20947]